VARSCRCGGSRRAAHKHRELFLAPHQRGERTGRTRARQRWGLAAQAAESLTRAEEADYRSCSSSQQMHSIFYNQLCSYVCALATEHCARRSRLLRPPAPSRTFEPAPGMEMLQTNSSVRSYYALVWLPGRLARLEGGERLLSLDCCLVYRRLRRNFCVRTKNARALVLEHTHSCSCRERNQTSHIVGASGTMTCRSLRLYSVTC
jgi:hypothetical protein